MAAALNKHPNMNTSEQSAPEVKSPVAITEAGITAFLSARYASLALPEWATLCATTSQVGGNLAIYGHTPADMKWVHGTGATVDAAFVEFKKGLPPTGLELAAQKREQAAKLLAEADAILNPPSRAVAPDPVPEASADAARKEELAHV